jgi:predicted AlkP superfamily phosphohydrolase/phosphomutase
MGLFDRLRGKPARRRVIFIGLDGTPCSLVRRLADDGTMPNMRRLIGEGTLKSMTTTIPEISSVAWSSFMTGVNPGKHGIYGFLDLQPQSYKVYFPNAKHVRSDTLWDLLGRRGKRSVVINVPSTYPAREINGVLISGFVAISLEKATYPPSLLPRLKELGYQIDVDARKIKESDEALLDDVFRTLDRRRVVLKELFAKEDWDLFVGVITATDRMQHFFWEAIEDPSHKFHSRFREFYGQVDEVIGHFAGNVGPNDTFFIMSDHGFAPLSRQVYLNHWLRERGYLTWSKETPETLEDIGPGSSAFVLDPARVYLNVKGKYPRGAVEPGDARALRDRLKREIAAITVEGQPIVARVYEKEEIFRGPLLDSAPDLCVVPVPGFDLKGAVNKTVLADRDVFTGMHTHDDALFWIGSRNVRQGDASILDVAPTLLSALGEEPPPGLDGRSFLDS